jgi:hypothetical protein
MVEEKEHKKIKIFQGKKVRTHWDEEKEKWFFSIVDVIAILTESVDPFAYWRKLKQRLLEEGNETVTNCHALKMLAQDGKIMQSAVNNNQKEHATFLHQTIKNLLASASTHNRRYTLRSIASVALSAAFCCSISAESVTFCRMNIRNRYLVFSISS